MIRDSRISDSKIHRCDSEQFRTPSSLGTCHGNCSLAYSRTAFSSFIFGWEEKLRSKYKKEKAVWPRKTTREPHTNRDGSFLCVQICLTLSF